MNQIYLLPAPIFLFLQLKVHKLSNHNKPNECPVSKASTELMLDRVCNGNSNEFPFSKNLETI